MAKLGISTGTVPNDGTGDTLLSGAIKVNSNFDEIYNYFGDGTNIGFTSGKWVTTAAGIHTLSNVGIGTTNPTSKLTVTGDGTFTGVVTATTFIGALTGNATGLSGTPNITIGTITATSATVGSAVTINSSGVSVTGVVTATSFIGDGSALTGVVGSGSGVVVKDSGTTVGTAGTIDFGDNLTVSAISAGIVTVTAIGSGSSQFAITTAGIHTLSNIGIGTTNPTSKLTIAGDGTFTGVVTATTFIGALTGTATTATLATNAQGLTGTPNITVGTINATSLNASGVTTSGTLNIGTGGTVITTTSAGLVGIGTTNPGEKLQVDGNIRVGISTTSNYITFRGTHYDGPANTGGELTYQHTYIGERIYDYSGNGERSELLVFKGNDIADISGPDRIRLFAGEHRFDVLGFSTTGTFEQVGVSTAAINKLTITSIGVGIGTTNPTSALTVVGSGTSTSQLFVTGVSTVGVVTGATYFGDASRIVSGKWTLGASGSNDYTFTGIGFTETTNDPALYLARGAVYEFVNNMGAHPFRIQSTPNGSAGTEYNNGVTNNNVSNGTLRFEIPFNAPNTLYYQCTAHAGMGGTLTIYPSV